MLVLLGSRDDFYRGDELFEEGEGFFSGALVIPT